MSDKLNQSLDTILSERRKSSRVARAPRGGRRTATGGRPAVAPAGGVKKNTRSAKTNDKAVATAVANKVATRGAPKGESKIIVSGLVS
jgi:THO complex subunit 4